MKHNREQMLLNEIMKYQFAVLDIALFLDNHPNDPVALSYQYKYATMLKQLRCEYERYYGPLTYYYPEKCNKWRYIKGPWPWERNY